jgi:hypothetical protein
MIEPYLGYSIFLVGLLVDTEQQLNVYNLILAEMKEAAHSSIIVDNRGFFRRARAILIPCLHFG